MLFSFGLITVHWYGLLVVSGIIAGLLVTLRLAKKVNLTADEIYNLAFYLIIFSLVGARIYAVFLELPYYLAYPGQIIAVWNGGLAIHGALLGGILTLLLYCRRHRQSFWLWADLLAMALPLGQAIGRWGNYFNQELFGRPTDLAWGIPITPINRPVGYENFSYFQPTFLYESILNLLNFLILLVLFQQRKKWHLKTGHLTLIYLINYSLIRIFMEFFRIDHTPLIFGIRVPVVVSALLIVASLSLIFFRRQKISGNDFPS